MDHLSIRSFCIELWQVMFFGAKLVLGHIMYPDEQLMDVFKGIGDW